MPEVQGVAGNLALQRILSLGIVQPRLTIGSPEDPLEQEADQVARQVVQPNPKPCACGGTCDRCQSNAPLIQRKADRIRATAGGATADRAVLKPGAGRPLDAGTRSFFETRIGHDFTGVRIHSGARAVTLAESIQARAYTTGNNIVFGQAQFAPSTAAGRKLLAHELTHVVQQKKPGQPTVQRQDEKNDQKKEDEGGCPAKEIKDPAARIRKLVSDGDHEGAFCVLNGLWMQHMLSVLQSLGSDVATLLSHKGAAGAFHSKRLEVAMQAVQHQGTTPEVFGLAYRAALETVPMDQRFEVLRFLGPVPEQPLGAMVEREEFNETTNKTETTVYIIHQGEVRFGKKGEKTKTWRTFNPGAITVPKAVAPSAREKEAQQERQQLLEEHKAYKDPSSPYGYQDDPTEGGAKLAVFPSEDEGKAALRDKLKAHKAKGLTLETYGMDQLGSRESGAAYAEVLVKVLAEINSKYSGITIQTPLSAIDTEDLVRATQRREGWNPEGKGQRIPWDDQEALSKLPRRVGFLVMLAKWVSGSS